MRAINKLKTPPLLAINFLLQPHSWRRLKLSALELFTKIKWGELERQQCNCCLGKWAAIVIASHTNEWKTGQAQKLQSARDSRERWVKIRAVQKVNRIKSGRHQENEQKPYFVIFYPQSSSLRFYKPKQKKLLTRYYLNFILASGQF